MTATITFAGGVSGVGHLNRDPGYRRLWACDSTVLDFPVATSAKAYKIFQLVCFCGIREQKERHSVMNIHRSSLLVTVSSTGLARISIPFADEPFYGNPVSPPPAYFSCTASPVRMLASSVHSESGSGHPLSECDTQLNATSFVCGYNCSALKRGYRFLSSCFAYLRRRIPHHFGPLLCFSVNPAGGSNRHLVRFDCESFGLIYIFLDNITDRIRRTSVLSRYRSACTSAFSDPFMYNFKFRKNKFCWHFISQNLHRGNRLRLRALAPRCCT